MGLKRRFIGISTTAKTSNNFTPNGVETKKIDWIPQPAEE
jgi:hypothetical protein